MFFIEFDQIILVIGLAAIVIIAIVFLALRYFLSTNKVSSANLVAVVDLDDNDPAKLRAELAERHVEELQLNIAEHERTSLALHESREKFRHAAMHDSLTDLPNRTYFAEEVKYQLEKTKIMPGFSFAVLFLDLNRFKTVNDSLGHSAGDRLILAVSKRLKEICRKGDMISRLGGDEFAILLNNATDQDEVQKYAELLQKKISVPVTLNGRQIFTSASIGIIFSNASYEDSLDILRDADMAMYAAKEQQKSFLVFDKSMHTQAVTVLQLDTDLRYAVAREEFCLFYQPILDINTMKLKGFEALVRWNHPQRGLVPPFEFIPTCEENGLIIPMTISILKKSCLQIKKWQQISPAHKDLTMSVNLSGKHFSHSSLIDDVAQVLAETELSPSSLRLEITESAVMENAETAVGLLEKLKELGVKLSIDDFGTGYSSLSYLNKFPVDNLKVDRSFVTSMSESSESGELVRAIISLAHTLGIAVVAEGIETVTQLHQLRILNCEFGQGYLFSRPVPEAEADKLTQNLDSWKDFAPTETIKLPQSLQPEQSNYLN
jgi:diguanylate cyclase (GGDEF)-like protein